MAAPGAVGGHAEEMTAAHPANEPAEGSER